MDQLRLMTVRSEGQFNTVVYEDEDIYRGQDRRDVILLHPDDMRRLGLAEDQRVTVRSETGVAAEHPRPLVPRDPRRQRPDVLSRGERARAAARRSALARRRRSRASSITIEAAVPLTRSAAVSG